MKQIRCPKCGKVVGEWEGDHINIKRIGLLVYGAGSMPRKCPNPRCGIVFDMIQALNGGGVDKP